MISLPLPPSDNRRLIVAWNQRRMVLSKEHRLYKKYIAQRFVGSNILHSPTFENQMKIGLVFHLKDKRRDATDMLKSLMDSLTGILFTDDKWVVPQIHFPYLIDKANPRVDLIVWVMARTIKGRCLNCKFFFNKRIPDCLKNRWGDCLLDEKNHSVVKTNHSCEKYETRWATLGGTKRFHLHAYASFMGGWF